MGIRSDTFCLKKKVVVQAYKSNNVMKMEWRYTDNKTIGLQNMNLTKVNE